MTKEKVKKILKECHKKIRKMTPEQKQKLRDFIRYMKCKRLSN